MWLLVSVDLDYLSFVLLFCPPEIGIIFKTIYIYMFVSLLGLAFVKKTCRNMKNNWN